jgi:hypothetical protein
MTKLGVNGIVFGNEGELYVQIGSNTNGGVPGPLTTKQIQKDNYYSAATVVAYLADPQFDGAITYDAADDGTPNGGSGIDVFAPGNRNPFGIVLHSNGLLYGTDNGPNLPYGKTYHAILSIVVPLLLTHFVIVDNNREYDDRMWNRKLYLRSRNRR